MKKIVIIGGGWAGCAAAIVAAKAQMKVILIERTDLLLGLGNVGGIMRNNGRFTAAEENIAMGASELFDITDQCATHRNVNFSGHEHASFYDVVKVEPKVRALLQNFGVEVRIMSRVVDVVTTTTTEESAVDQELQREESGQRLVAVRLAEGELIEGDVFIDCTGTTGPMGNCTAYGNGCSMCVLRCPAFGPRVSITQKVTGQDYCGMRSNKALGAFSGSCKLDKSSLSKKLQKELNKRGVAIVPLPEDLINRNKLGQKVCQQYALEPFAENIILIDTGFAKMMTPYFPIRDLRRVDGFSDARYIDPYAGGKGNSVRYMACARHDGFLRVCGAGPGVSNLFCAGEKAGLIVGHTEAIATGSLAGYNACRQALSRTLLELPETTACGMLIAMSGKNFWEANPRETDFTRRFTFAGDEVLDELKAKGLYTTDLKAIRDRIERVGLVDVYNLC